MNLHTILFGTFTPPVAHQVRSNQTFGSGDFEPSAYSKAQEKNLSRRYAEMTAVEDYVKQHPDTTFDLILTHMGWRHNKTYNVMRSLLDARRIKRYSVSNPKGGPKTFRYKAA